MGSTAARPGPRLVSFSIEDPLMRPSSPFLSTLAGLAMLGVAAACSSDLATRPGGAAAGGTVNAVTATLAMHLASTSDSTGGAATMTGMLTGDFGGFGGFGDFGDGMGHHWRGWWGWAHTRDVDSLIVTATKIEVLRILPDTGSADSTADSTSNYGDWQQREFGWTQLPIIGSGHLDLIHLPDSAAAGLPVATDTLPAGTYRHVRLFFVNPLIYFDSLIVTPAGDTLQAGVGYPVVFPNADSTGATIRTDTPFVVGAVGDTVPVYFDRENTLRHIIITRDGTIIVPPVMRFGFGGH